MGAYLGVGTCPGHYGTPPTPHLSLPPSLSPSPLIYLDRDDKMSLILEEVLSIDRDNPGLVWLCHISKYDVYHTYSVYIP